jgi:EAL domain-containing protein (putative c-di-GMP-specific phosphodiesterase class I)
MAAEPARMQPPPALDGASVRALEQLLSTRGVRAVYQPLVDLERRQVVGYDALARGPAGSALELPARMFALARDLGRVDELDMRCRAAALEGALDADLGSWLTLFVTVEPDVLGAPIPDDVEYLLRTAEQRLRLVLEIGPRALEMRPAELLRAVDWAHERYWGIALDNVGGHPLSLALLPFLRPDVVKLDLRLLQSLPATRAAHVVNAVLAYVEHSGATILAEGIETEQQIELALTLGATLGQGWLFGRPGPLPVDPRPSKATIPLTQTAPLSEHRTPFEIVSPQRAARMARGGLLAALTEQLEAEALGVADAPVVLASFPSVEHFPAARYGALANRGALVAAFVPGVGPVPAPGVRGADITIGDPLADEWSVVVVGPFSAGAVVARSLGDEGPAHRRRYSFATTSDRDVVLAAARALMTRIA